MTILDILAIIVVGLCASNVVFYGVVQFAEKITDGKPLEEEDLPTYLKRLLIFNKRTWFQSLLVTFFGLIMLFG